MSEHRDIDTPGGYPLPCDPVTGMGWWRFNLAACFQIKHWREWQAQKRMDEIIPVLRWFVYGSIPEKLNG